MKKNLLCFLISLLYWSNSLSAQSVLDEIWKYTKTCIVNSNLQFSRGMNYNPGKGFKSSKIFSYQVESEDEDKFFFYRQNIMYDLIDRRNLYIIDFKQYQPEVTVKNYSLGMGFYLDGNLLENINFYSDFSLGLAFSKAKINNKEIKNTYLNLGLSFGESQLITPQLRYSIGLHVNSPFLYPKVRTIEDYERFQTLTITIDLGLQFILFKHR